jgi:hypothetical protein
MKRKCYPRNDHFCIYRPSINAFGLWCHCFQSVFNSLLFHGCIQHEIAISVDHTAVKTRLDGTRIYRDFFEQPTWPKHFGEDVVETVKQEPENAIVLMSVYSDDSMTLFCGGLVGISQIRMCVANSNHSINPKCFQAASCQLVYSCSTAV